VTEDVYFADARQSLYEVDVASETAAEGCETANCAD
jgi:hypothetical protein